MRRGGAERLRPTGTALLLALGAGLAVFCAGGPGEESVTCTTSAIMGNHTIDTRFPAVGITAGCTATLVGPDAILFAAHCVSAYAQGCETKEQTLRELTFTLSASGCLASVDRAGESCKGESATYRVADVAVHPRAYDLSGCTELHCRPAAALAVDTALLPVFDVALARLVRPAVPIQIGAVLPVITSITDDDVVPFTIHRRLDDQRFRRAVGCERPQGIVVGWGANDLNAVVRVAGVVDFFDGPGWDQVCQRVNECGDAGRPASFCPLEKRAASIQVQALRTHRGSSTPGAFDREVTWLGDSGSPLLVRGGTAADAVPELKEGLFVVGVLSGGELPTLPLVAGQDTEDVHAATFEPSNARFIEETLARFAAAPSDLAIGDVPNDDAGATADTRTNARRVR